MTAGGFEAYRREDWRKRPRVWTRPLRLRLAELLDAGLADEVIARELSAAFGCRLTAEAVNLARKRYGIASRTRRAHTGRSVARLLGLGCSKQVARWCRAGWLRGRQTQRRGGNRQWRILHDDLLAFLEDEAHWHRWQPERITDAALREWALELRAGVAFLTVGQVAERCYVEPTTVNQWIHRGELPAVRNGNWLVRSDVLADFVPPGQRPRTSFTPADDELIVRMRAEGAYWREIAALLGRPETTVANRARQLERERSSGATSENAR